MQEPGAGEGKARDLEGISKKANYIVGELSDSCRKRETPEVLRPWLRRLRPKDTG